MTATHDKEWIEVRKNKAYTTFDVKPERKDSPLDDGMLIVIDNTLLDQIRRDAVELYKSETHWNDTMKAVKLKAKKELLDEFDKIPLVKEHPNWIIFHKDAIKELRAKTLGEQQKSKAFLSCSSDDSQQVKKE